MYNIIYETSRQSRFDARYWMLGAGALGRPRRMVRGGRREEGSGWGTRVYLWRIHVDIWQKQYNIVKLKNKIKFKKIKKKRKKKEKTNKKTKFPIHPSSSCITRIQISSCQPSLDISPPCTDRSQLSCCQKPI